MIQLIITRHTLSIKDHEGEGTAEWDLDIQVDPGVTVTILSSIVLECAHGGYVQWMSKEFTGELLGRGPDLTGNTTTSYSKNYGEPAAAMVIYCRYTADSDPTVERAALFTLPVAFDASTVWSSTVEDRPTVIATTDPEATPQGDVGAGVFLGAMAPIDAVDIILVRDATLGTHRMLLLTGQILNLRRLPEFVLSFKDAAKTPFERWHLRVHDDATGTDVIDQDLGLRDDWPGVGASVNDLTAWFNYSLFLPSTFSFGRVELQLVHAGVDITYRRQIAFEPADVLHLPMDPKEFLFLDAKINFGGGPAAPEGESHGHNGSMKQRYAYDMGARVAGQRLRPFGSESELGAHWTFGSPILALADGVVTRVEGGEPDAINSSGRGNRITIRHDHAPEPRYSVYAHCRQDTASVSVGDRVSAGQQIAEVGSSGDSSAPHLHVAYYEFDGWARCRMLPMAFTVAVSDEAVVTGVPQSGLQLDPPFEEGAANPGLWGAIDQTLGEFVDAVEDVVDTVVGWFRR